MADPAEGARRFDNVAHAVGFFLGAGLFSFFTWLQIQLIGPRWTDVTLVFALIVALLMLRGLHHARAALRAASGGAG
jgi:hypothetical protein